MSVCLSVCGPRLRIVHLRACTIHALCVSVACMQGRVGSEVGVLCGGGAAALRHSAVLQEPEEELSRRTAHHGGDRFYFFPNDLYLRLVRFL